MEARDTQRIRVVLATLLTGILAGVIGILLSWFLHLVQHLAYGYDLHAWAGDISFLHGVEDASPVHRLIVLTVCGLVAGYGWFWIHRYLPPIFSVERALRDAKPMPILTTVCHGLLEIGTVALGSPLGREKAPREMSALCSGWLAQYLRLDAHTMRVMLACGAGAGLAAIYNVPLAGMMFTLEALLRTLRWSAVLPAIMTSAIAVWISWIGLGDYVVFPVPPMLVTADVLYWSICVGPILGVVAYWFMVEIEKAQKRAPREWSMPLYCTLNFVFIGVLAMYFPMILGNGRSVVNIAFTDSNTLVLSLTLFAIRMGITWTSVRFGAYGGFLTPSLANGALLGLILGNIWNLILPPIDINIAAILGAVGFLAAAERIPMTAILLIFEFTRLHLGFGVPVLCAVFGAMVGAQIMKNMRR
jgi:H+/Cl- antiporter ClcA